MLPAEQKQHTAENGTQLVLRGAAETPKQDTIEETTHGDECPSGGERKRAPFLAGWRVYTLAFGLCMSLLLSTLETTIVSTSLVSISNSLDSYDSSNWIVTSYLLTYTGFLIIFAKFSDILGRKTMILTGLSLFTAASVACGCAQTSQQLVVFRAFQGIGGSGIYSMVSVIVPEMVPPQLYGTYMGAISSVFAVSSILGPILGGAITGHATWRWVFLLNAPGGALAIGLVSWLLPNGFPYEPESRGSAWRFGRGGFARDVLRRLDWPGVVLSLIGSILLAYALEEGGTVYPWKSAPIVATLTISGVAWIAFVLRERSITAHQNSVQEPIFPWRLITSRLSGGVMLVGFLTGFPFMAAIINLPQRFQAVNGLNPTAAGLRMLPLLLCSPFASALVAVFAFRLRIPPLLILIAACVLQTLGVSLLATLPTDAAVHPEQYGYQVLIGAGVGLGLSTLLVMVRIVNAEQDLAVAMGAITQVRVLGGTIGLAVCNSVLNARLRRRLAAFLSPAQMAALLKSTDAAAALSSEVRAEVREAYAEGFNTQMAAMAGVAGACLLVACLLWESPPRKLPAMDGERGEDAEKSGR